MGFLKIIILNSTRNFLENDLLIYEEGKKLKNSVVCSLMQFFQKFRSLSLFSLPNKQNKKNHVF